MLAIKSKKAILNILATRIKAHRLSQNLSQKDLAEKSGVAYSTLRKIESTGEGSMSDYLSLLIALGQISQIDQFLPEPQINPELIFKTQGKKRIRATRRDNLLKGQTDGNS